MEVKEEVQPLFLEEPFCKLIDGNAITMLLGEQESVRKGQALRVRLHI